MGGGIGFELRVFTLLHEVLSPVNIYRPHFLKLFVQGQQVFLQEGFCYRYRCGRADFENLLSKKKI